MVEQDALTQAKQYQKQRKWDKAVEYYAQCMNDQANLADSTYVSYAKCLRMIDQTKQAKEILQEGYSLYPKSEKVLVELFYLYEHLRSWENARSAASALIDVNPQKGEHYFKLGRAYAYLFNEEQAKQAYRTGLIYRHELPFENLIEKIKTGFTDDVKMVTTEYVFSGGKNNLGAFLHEYQGGKYFTKISKSNRSTLREVAFYKNIYAQFPVLADIVPSYIDAQTLDNIQYLTIEAIDDSKQTKSIEQVIQASRQISAIAYQDIIKNYPNPDYTFSFKHKGYSIVLFFTQIHQEHYNKKLFASLKQYVAQKKYSEEVVQILTRVEALIMDNRLYAFIKPDEHYSLLHGDFTPNNIKVKNENGAVQVFDWASFKVGPHFLDVARYVAYAASGLISYDKVKELYLFNKQTEKGLSLIEQIFFLYAYILMYVADLKSKNRHKIVSEFMWPALEDMEECVARFKQEAFGSAMQSLLDDKNSVTQENEKLRSTLKNVQKRKSDLEVKLQHIVESRSWKITAPLRKLTYPFRKK